MGDVLLRACLWGRGGDTEQVKVNGLEGAELIDSRKAGLLGY